MGNIKDDIKAELKAELLKFMGDIRSMNAQLQDLESKKSEILKVGTRIEGIISYLRGKFAAEELAIIDALSLPPAPVANPPAPAVVPPELGPAA